MRYLRGPVEQEPVRRRRAFGGAVRRARHGLTVGVVVVGLLYGTAACERGTDPEPEAARSGFHAEVSAVPEDGLARVDVVLLRVRAGADDEVVAVIEQRRVELSEVGGEATDERRFTGLLEVPTGELVPIDVFVGGPDRATLTTGVVVDEPGASIDRIVDDEVVDTSGIGEPDTWRIGIAVEVVESGSYRLNVDLVDLEGVHVVSATGAGVLEPGPALIDVELPVELVEGWETADPLQVVNATLSRGDGAPIRAASWSTPVRCRRSLSLNALGRPSSRHPRRGVRCPPRGGSDLRVGVRSPWLGPPFAHGREPRRRGQRTTSCKPPTTKEHDVRKTLILAAAGIAVLAVPTAAAADGHGQRFSAELRQANDSGASASAELWLDGNDLTVSIQGQGFFDGFPHAMHLHGEPGGDNICGPLNPGEAGFDEKDVDGDGILSVIEGAGDYGPVAASLTTEGDTSPESALAVDRFPTSSTLDYERTFEVSDEIARNLSSLHIVVHALDLDGSGEIGTVEIESSLDPDLPIEATAPAACGQITASAAGGIDTGAGGTANEPTGGALGVVAAGAMGLVALGAVTVRRRGERA